MRFAVSYKREEFAEHGAAEVTFVVQAGDPDTAQAVAAELYTTAYGRTPSDDFAELVGVRIVS